MGLKEEVQELKQQGFEQAATIWEMLENLPQPIAPINIYKAACASKCAEFLTRLRNNMLLAVVMKSVTQFLDGTLEIAESFTGSSSAEGMRAVAVFEEVMPLTDEVFANTKKYAQRQHVYDGVIMLAALKMGREKETKECIDRLQMGIGKAMRLAMFAESLVSKDNK